MPEPTCSPGSTASRLAKLAANLDRVSFRKGEAACIEGEPGDSLYIVSEGTFGVFVGGAGDDRKLWVATLRPGGCFGEMALLTGEPRSASVIADGEGELLRLDQERFTDLLRRDPSIGLALSASLSRRLHGALRSIREGDELVRRQTESRLAQMPPDARERVLEASILPEATPAALECLFGPHGPDLSSRLVELGWRDGRAPEPIARALREAPRDAGRGGGGPGFCAERGRAIGRGRPLARSLAARRKRRSRRLHCAPWPCVTRRQPRRGTTSLRRSNG